MNRHLYERLENSLSYVARHLRNDLDLTDDATSEVISDYLHALAQVDVPGARGLSDEFRREES